MIYLKNNMSNPQLENGYVRIATELWEALCRIRIPGEARQILDFIIRKTYGFQKRSDRIALSQFVEGTGISKPHVVRGLRKLESMNMIVIKTDNAIAQKGNGNIVSYSLNKAYTDWMPLPKKATRRCPKRVPQKIILQKIIQKILVAPFQNRFRNQHLNCRDY